jgi:hypothetical protein
MTFSQRLIYCLLAVSLLILSASATAQDTGAAVKYERDGHWKPLFVGIDGLNLSVSAPRKMKAYAARIQLDAPGISFVATPDNGEKPEETEGVCTSTFLKQQKCQLAINAGAFSPVTDTEGTGKDILGLHVAEGKVISPWQNGYHALTIDKRNEAKIIRDEEKDLAEVQTAICGFQVNLWKGDLLKSNATIHPRTVLGVSKDGKVMVWLVIDGRQPGHSEGAKTDEAGFLLKELGAEDGINLDGGGTSTLVMEDADGKPKVINRPIHRNIPGLERPGASHLGVRATALKK